VSARAGEEDCRARTPSADSSCDSTRDDGSKQWAYKGKPVDYWSKDQKAGDRTGDGVANAWRLARP